MSLENLSADVPDAEKLSVVLAQIGAPAELMKRMIELSQEFGPELLTAVLGYVSIFLINRGSSKYGELNPDVHEERKRTITMDASEQIAMGTVGMAATAFAAGNPLFAYPELLAVVGALKPYLESLYPRAAVLSEALRLDLVVKAAAIGVGGTVAYEHAQNVMQVLPPLSLTALSVAFSGHVRQEMYRFLTLSGGTGLVIGSAYAAHEASKAGNAVGTIMSIAFLALNALFTRNEWKEVQKMGGARKVVTGVGQAVWEKVRSLFSSRNIEDPLEPD